MLIDYVARAWNLLYGVITLLPHVFLAILSFSIGGYVLNSVIRFLLDL